jgi:hypothetical protein
VDGSEVRAAVLRCVGTVYQFKRGGGWQIRKQLLQTGASHLPREPESSDSGNILAFDKGLAPDLRNELQRQAPRQLVEAERLAAIGMMACLISL